MSQATLVSKATDFYEVREVPDLQKKAVDKRTARLAKAAAKRGHAAGGAAIPRSEEDMLHYILTLYYIMMYREKIGDTKWRHQKNFAKNAYLSA
jgi:hypothetical protein